MRKEWKVKPKSRKFLLRFLPAAVFFLLLLAAAVYTVFVKPGLSEDIIVYKEETVQRGDLVSGIMESGNITLEETSFEYPLALHTSDEENEEQDDEEDENEEEETVKYPELAEVYVAAGQRIEKGDALFRLTEESVKAVKKRLDSLYAEAEIALSEAETDYRIQLLAAEKIRDTSLLEGKQARSSLQAAAAVTQESVNGLSADIKVLEEEIAWNQEQLEREELWESLKEAQIKYTAALNLYESTDVHNATAYADNYAACKTAKDSLESIQERIEALRKSIEDAKDSIAEKEAELADAQALLEAKSLENKSSYESAVLAGELAEDIYQYTEASLREAVSAAEADKEEAKEQMDEFAAFTGDDGMIYADGSGLVTGVLYSAGDRLEEAGAMLSYVKEDACTVSVDVSEEDISGIQTGDRVNVVITAYPDTVYEGTVTAITTTVSSKYTATVSYPVDIRIEGDTSLLYGGMTAEVTFVTDSVSDVLHVSRKAVQTIDGKSYVYVDGGSGKKERVEVVTGFSDGSEIEIVSGLSEGDTVYMESRMSGNEGELTQKEERGDEKQPEETGDAGAFQGEGSAESRRDAQ